jgi:hypothetical protein
MNNPQKALVHSTGWLRRYWIIGAAALVLIMLAVGAPSWAAPVLRPLNQTVPRPTPTSGGDPLATATPRAGDDEDGGESGEGGDAGQPLDPGAPALPGLPPQSESGSTPTAPARTATVDTATLNVREGPGTDFGVLGSLTAGAEVTVLARNDDGSWWVICCVPDTPTQGWVNAQLLTPSFDRTQAQTLLPLFGAQAAAPPAAPAAASAALTTAASTSAGQAELPLAVDFQLDPPFVWQGATATLEIRVLNPNQVEVGDVELSDELPAALTLLEAAAGDGGTVEQITTSTGNPLLLFNWTAIPAGGAVSAQLQFEVAGDLADGAVIDNLVGVRANNAAYGAGAFTIGMPPVALPAFE